MFGKSDAKNPFYLLLIAAGCAFAITACAYGVMTVRELRDSRAGGFAEEDSAASRFNRVMDEHGTALLIVELVLLGVGTFGAIAYDHQMEKKAGATRSAMRPPELGDKNDD